MQRTLGAIKTLREIVDDGGIARNGAGTTCGCFV
jgi:hypothetical protein